MNWLDTHTHKMIKPELYVTLSSKKILKFNLQNQIPIDDFREVSEEMRLSGGKNSRCTQNYGTQDRRMVGTVKIEGFRIFWKEKVKFITSEKGYIIRKKIGTV